MVRTFWPTLVAALALVLVPVTAEVGYGGTPAQEQAPDTASTATKDPEITSAAASTSAMGEPRPLLRTPVPDNPLLVARLQALLPRDMAIEQAARGFDDQRDFVAAVHAARNLRVQFRDLKARMVGDEMSLDEAIEALRPDADVEHEVKRARRQADADLTW